MGVRVSLPRKLPVKPLPLACAALLGLPLSASPHGPVAHDPAAHDPVALAAVVQDGPRPKDPAAVVANAVEAAEAFLGTLDEAQKKKVLYAFDDDAQRRNWTNLPVGMNGRGGLRWGDLNETQRKAVTAMLAATLSPEGLAQVRENMLGDEALKHGRGGGRGPGAPGGNRGGRGGPDDRGPRDGGPGDRGPGGRGPGGPGDQGSGGRGPGGAGGGRPGFGEDNYFVAILGTPSTTEPWMWMFGGHHLAVNATLSGGKITLSPTLTGGQPMTYERQGETVRQLDDERKAAFAFLKSLRPEQLKKAVLDDRGTRVEFGPGDDDAKVRPEGLRANELDDAQRKLLLALIRQRVGLVNEVFAAAEMQEIQSSLGDTYFAWFGATDSADAAAYRVQGPNVVIEYVPQGRGGEGEANHVHAMYRDPAFDYGGVRVNAGR